MTLFESKLCKEINCRDRKKKKKPTSGKPEGEQPNCEYWWHSE